jgi:xanthine dehydrogenase accessory factor
MYEIAAAVRGWLDEGRPVTLARLIDTRGFSSTDPAASVAFTPDEELVGALLADAANGQLAAALGVIRSPTVIEVAVDDAEALSAGLSCGGRARLLAQPATDLSRADWDRLEAALPSCIVTDIAGDGTASTTLFSPDGIAALDSAPAPEVRRLFARGTSRTSAFESEHALTVATALWPVSRLAVVGDGLIADALAAVGELLDWPVERMTDPADGAAVAQTLRPGDGIVVLSHDLEVAGPALLAALGAKVAAGDAGPGYIGALGSRRTQANRAAWLSEHGVSPEQLRLIHGPAVWTSARRLRSRSPSRSSRRCSASGRGPSQGRWVATRRSARCGTAAGRCIPPASRLPRRGTRPPDALVWPAESGPTVALCRHGS